MKLTERFEHALVYATRLHANQLRKGTQVPYLSHLLSVAALVIENGGDEDQAIAALLHDAVEDQGGLPRLNEIRGLFGERVSRIVDGCTDAYKVPKPAWRKRKEQYLLRLRDEPPEVRLVSLADKVHNARSLLATLNLEGKDAWSKFNGGQDGTIWYYKELAREFQTTSDHPLTRELSRLIEAIEDFIY